MKNRRNFVLRALRVFKRENIRSPEKKHTHIYNAWALFIGCERVCNLRWINKRTISGAQKPTVAKKPNNRKHINTYIVHIHSKLMIDVNAMNNEVKWLYCCMEHVGVCGVCRDNNENEKRTCKRVRERENEMKWKLHITSTSYNFDIENNLYWIQILCTVKTI